MDLESYQESETESDLNSCTIEDFQSVSGTVEYSANNGNHEYAESFTYKVEETEDLIPDTNSTSQEETEELEELAPYFCGICADFIYHPSEPSALRKGSLSDPQLNAYVTYLHHIKEHIIKNMLPGGSETEDYNSALLDYVCHFDTKDNTSRETLRNSLEKEFKRYMPKSCQWRRTVQGRGDHQIVCDTVCGYEFDRDNVDDYLRHTYYHAHQVRIEECGLRHVRKKDILKNFQHCGGIPPCLTNQIDPATQFQKMAGFGGKCKWIIPRDDVEPCHYFSFIPEFLMRHLHDEVDCYWNPLMWKKDTMIGCNWDGCDFIVDTTSKGSKTMNRLKAHVQTHIKLKPIACPFCCERLSCGKRLDEHFSRQCQTKSDLFCDICGKSFATKTLLRDHLTNHNRKFACPINSCSFMGRNFRSVATHLQYVHSDERKFGPCPFCDKYFKTLKDYKAHIVTHNKSGEFKCEKCDYVTTTLKSLRYHERFKHKKTTSGEQVKGYKCHICHDKVFTRGFKLSQHFRKDHKDEDTRFAEPKDKAKMKRQRFQYLLQPDGYYMLDNSSQKEDLHDIHMPDLERKELYTIPASSELFIADYQQDFGLKSKAIYQCPHCKTMFRKKITLDNHVEQCDVRPGSQFLAIVESMEPRIQHLSAELQAEVEVEMESKKRKAGRESLDRKKSSKKPFTSSLQSASTSKFMKSGPSSSSENSLPPNSITQVDPKLKIPPEGDFVHVGGKFYYQLTDKDSGSPVLYQISEDTNTMPALQN